jgi:uncharacterized sulfatase
MKTSTIAAILLLLSLVAAPAAEPPKKPSVLFIAVDDMNNDLGCYGNPQVQAPNIDHLAARGVRFERAYCQYALCSPSRSSLMTGLRPDTTRVFDLKYHFRQGLPDVVTLPQMFRANGYYAARVGKIYHYGNPQQIGTSGLDDPASWDEFRNPAGRDRTALEPDLIYADGPGKRGSGKHYMAYYNDKAGTDEQHTDGKVALQAIELMEKHKDKPFFLAVGFYKPHAPWITPGGYFEKYSLDTITLPAIAPNYRRTVPAPALEATKPWPYCGAPPQFARECKLGYYASISFVDAQIGRVLDALDRLGLRDNTIVVFWSDHGFQLGEHGLWFKTDCFEEADRVPLIIVPPGTKNAGKISPRTVELVDLYPTLADLAGMTPPKNLEGFSLRPLLENPDAPWSHAAFTQVQRGKFPGHSVRTERWRYTEWDFGKQGAELYDHDADPHELINLASDPKYADTIAEMKALLKTVHPKPVQGGKAKPGFAKSLGLKTGNDVHE